MVFWMRGTVVGLESRRWRRAGSSPSRISRYATGKSEMIATALANANSKAGDLRSEDHLRTLPADDSLIAIVSVGFGMDSIR